MSTSTATPTPNAQHLVSSFVSSSPPSASPTSSIPSHLGRFPLTNTRSDASHLSSSSASFDLGSSASGIHSPSSLQINPSDPFGFSSRSPPPHIQRVIAERAVPPIEQGRGSRDVSEYLDVLEQQRLTSPLSSFSHGFSGFSRPTSEGNGGNNPISSVASAKMRYIPSSNTPIPTSDSNRPSGDSSSNIWQGDNGSTRDPRNEDTANQTEQETSFRSSGESSSSFTKHGRPLTSSGGSAGIGGSIMASGSSIFNQQQQSTSGGSGGLSGSAQPFVPSSNSPLASATALQEWGGFSEGNTSVGGKRSESGGSASTTSVIGEERRSPVSARRPSSLEPVKEEMVPVSLVSPLLDRITSLESSFRMVRTLVDDVHSLRIDVDRLKNVVGADSTPVGFGGGSTTGGSPLASRRDSVSPERPFNNNNNNRRSSSPIGAERAAAIDSLSSKLEAIKSSIGTSLPQSTTPAQGDNNNIRGIGFGLGGPSISPKGTFSTMHRPQHRASLPAVPTLSSIDPNQLPSVLNPPGVFGHFVGVSDELQTFPASTWIEAQNTVNFQHPTQQQQQASPQQQFQQFQQVGLGQGPHLPRPQPVSSVATTGMGINTTTSHGGGKGMQEMRSNHGHRGRGPSISPDHVRRESFHMSGSPSSGDPSVSGDSSNSRVSGGQQRWDPVPSQQQPVGTAPSGSLFGKWEMLGLTPEVVRALVKNVLRIGPPSKIQQKSIPSLLQNHDVLAQAPAIQERIQSYVVPGIHIIHTAMTNSPPIPYLGPNSRSNFQHPVASTGGLQMLVVTATIDQAAQAHRLALGLGTNLGIRTSLSVGQGDMNQELLTLQSTMPHILIGTPHRLLDIIAMRMLPLGDLRLVVFDEMDQLLARNMGELVTNLYRLLSAAASSPNSSQIRSIQRQTAIYSCTVPQDVLNFANTLNLREGVRIYIRRDHADNSSPSVRGLRQYYVYVAIQGRETASSAREWKLEALVDLCEDNSFTQAIVYCSSVDSVEAVSYKLNSRGIDALALHQDMGAASRHSILSKFRSANTIPGRSNKKVLVIYDVLCRTMNDIHQVPLVVNFDLCRAPEDYVHRVACATASGYGRPGVAVNIVSSPSDIDMIRQIEALHSCKIQSFPPQGLTF